MRPIHRREDLVALVRNHAPTNAAQRALDESGGMVLGGFRPPDAPPFWAVRIESGRGRVWLVTIEPHEARRTYRPRYPDRINWENWDGKLGRNHPVYDGDAPEMFEHLRAIKHTTYAGLETKECRFPPTTKLRRSKPFGILKSSTESL